MGLKYSSFAIRGIDVSQFNGAIDWLKLTSISHNFCAVRGGYGRVKDFRFDENWAAAKGKVDRTIYWYLDYYSNHIKGWGADGVSDRDWGRQQADACYAAQKIDPSAIIWLDIENGNPAYAPALSSVSTRAKTIAKGFLERMDELNKKKNGIYCSVGLLSWFDTWFKDRPLWVAWYNESQTPDSVRKAVAATGWIGKVMIWQYASHGCVYGDGVPQGKNLGTQILELDLNWFLGTVNDYALLFGKPVVVTPEDETPIELPEDDPIDVTGEFVAYLINTGKLNVRALPTTNSKIVGSYLSGWPVNVEKSVDLGVGSLTGWKRLYGQQGYLSMDYLKKV
jgi:GH25 family lysozyme M1 (1,4-beta-N-acetylmuramidase)